MDASSLKNKVAASIVAISSIHLLRVFMDAKNVPDNKRMQREGKKVRGLPEKMLTEANLSSLRLLNEMAHARGQTMAQMALSWLLKEVNPHQFIFAKAQVIQRLNVLFQLLRAARANQYRRYTLIFQQPA